MRAAAPSTNAAVDAPRKRRADIVVHEIDGEGILYDPRTGNSHRLNETALEIYQLCDGTAAAADLAMSLSHRYAERIEVLGEQVRAALNALDARGLLEPIARQDEDVSRE